MKGDARGKQENEGVFSGSDLLKQAGSLVVQAQGDQDVDHENKVHAGDPRLPALPVLPAAPGEGSADRGERLAQVECADGACPAVQRRQLEVLTGQLTQGGPPRRENPITRRLA